MIEIGMKYEDKVLIAGIMTANHRGSGDLAVFSTPDMIALMENVSYRAVSESIEGGYTTVGIKIDVSHEAALIPGSIVTCKSELIEIDRKRLVFKVEVLDEEGIVGKGIHERFIVSKDKIMEKAESRSASSKIGSATAKGNPAKPTGEDGVQMLERMNECHSLVTDWAISILKPKEEECILDIGCGGGATLNKISSKIEKGKLTGVDYSEVSVIESKKFNKSDIEAGKMDIVFASVEKLPFEDASFDKIITVESFYFWPNHQENLKEVFRVLKPGGRLLIVHDIYDRPDIIKKHEDNIKKYNLFVPGDAKFEELLLKANFTGVRIHHKEGEEWIAAEGVKGK